MIEDVHFNPQRFARERFRLASRQMMRAPADRGRHEARAHAALALEGAEPLQGALVDLLHACAPAEARLRDLMQRDGVQSRLPAFVFAALNALAASGQRLPRVSTLATRWCVLVAPSLDVPQRALLCSADDSRRIAAAALPGLLAGDAETERGFLAHCEGAGDALAFMLARRALTRAGRPLTEGWDTVSLILQDGVL